MCGRFACFASADEIVRTFSADLILEELGPSWAKAPGEGPLLISARAETLTSKPSFRAASRRRRAIVPANGYHEWTTSGAPKTPYFLHPADDGILGFAAVSDWWHAPDGWLCSAATAALVPRRVGPVRGNHPGLIAEVRP